MPESLLSNAVSIKLRLVDWIELILELLVTSVVECLCCCCCFTGKSNVFFLFLYFLPKYVHAYLKISYSVIVVFRVEGHK